VLDVVAAQQDELALPVEIVDVDDPEARLARPAPIGARQAEAPAGQPAQHEGEQREQHEDDREGDHVLNRRRGFDAEFRQQDATLQNSRWRSRAVTTAPALSRGHACGATW
jgi:hypothetical protein